MKNTVWWIPAIWGLPANHLTYVLYSQLLLYRTLGYTGIRTYRTENFSPAETAHSMFCTVWYSDIPDFLYTGL